MGASLRERGLMIRNIWQESVCFVLFLGRGPGGGGSIVPVGHRDSTFYWARWSGSICVSQGRQRDFTARYYHVE